MVKIRSCLVSITDSVQLCPQWFAVNSGWRIYTINMEWHLTNSCLYFGHHTFAGGLLNRGELDSCFCFSKSQPSVSSTKWLNPLSLRSFSVLLLLFLLIDRQWAAADWLTAVSFPEDNNNNYQKPDTDSCQALFLMLKNLTLTTALYFRYSYHPPLIEEYTMYQGSLTWSRSQLTSGSMNQHAWCPCARVCLVTQSCLTLCNPMDCSLLGSPVHGDSPGKNTWVGCLALLQGIFPTQRSNPGLPHCRQTHYHLSHQGSPWILE